jgi:hypothetical protein
MSPPIKNTRVATLIERFTTRTSWIDGIKTTTEDDFTINQQLSEIASLTRQTKAASTSIGKITSEFKDVLTDKEKNVLCDAHDILAALGKSVAQAKTVVKQRASVIKKETEERDKAARTVVAKHFDNLDVPEQVLWILHRKDRGYGEAKSLEHAVRDASTKGCSLVNYELNGAFTAMRQHLEYDITSEMRKGTTADEAVKSFRQKFESAKPELLASNGEFINRVVAALIQLRLEVATRHA